MSRAYDLIVGVGTTIVDIAGGSVQVNGGTSVLQVDAKQLRHPGMPYHPELQYLALLQELVEKSEGEVREDRTGTGTFSVFGRQIRFDLNKGFPLLTTKKLFTRGIIAELLWMLSGSTNIKALVDQGVHIWDEWADENGELGPVYGAQWRKWPAFAPAKFSNVHFFDGDGKELDGFHKHTAVDQITTLIQNLIAKPNDRGHVVSAWNAADLDRMALRPCHCLMQFYVEDGRLSCQLYQRSADIFLGVPFNIASYALLTHLIAREVGLGVGEFVHTFGDLHLYSNHVEQAKEQLTRSPRPLPLIEIASKGIFDLKTEDIQVVAYEPHPAIKGEVSV